MNFVGACVSLGVVVLAPILFIVGMRRTFKIGIKDFITGLLSCFFFKILCFNALIHVLVKIPGFIDLFSETMMISFLSAIATTITVFLGFLIIYKFIYQGSLTKKEVAGFAAGAVFIEIYYSLLNPTLSNFIYCYEIQNHTLETTLGAVYSAEEIANIIQTYHTYPFAYYIYFGVMVFMVISNNFLITAMFYNQGRVHSKVNLLMIFIVILAYSCFYYFTSPIAMPMVVIAVLVLTFIQFWFTHKYLQLRIE